MSRNQRISKAFKARLFGTKSEPRPKSVDPRRPYVKLLRDALRVSETKLEEVVTKLIAESGEQAGTYLAWAATDLRTTPEQCVLFLKIIRERGLDYNPSVIWVVCDLSNNTNPDIRQAAQALTDTMQPLSPEQPTPLNSKKSARPRDIDSERQPRI